MRDEEIIEKALGILESRLREPECVVTQPRYAKEFLKLKFNDLEHETFQVMFLNSQHELIQFEEMFRGTIDAASVYPREVVKAALQFNAAAVVLAHNHPSGVCEPSPADRRITERLVDALGLIDVRVLDHIVVGGNSACSFAERGYL